jgi:integrase
MGRTFVIDTISETQQVEQRRDAIPKNVRKSKKLPVAISKDEFMKLIKATNQDKHKLAFLLGFESGLRVSEIVKLEARDINFPEKNIFIRQGKGSKDRVVPLSKHFRESYLKMLPLGIGVRALEIAFKRCCKRAGLLEIKPTLHFHSLRHGFASHCVNQGVPIHHVRTLMGHSNISTTNVYLELNPKQALKSVEDLF